MIHGLAAGFKVYPGFQISRLHTELGGENNHRGVDYFTVQERDDAVINLVCSKAVQLMIPCPFFGHKPRIQETFWCLSSVSTPAEPTFE